MKNLKIKKIIITIMLLVMVIAFTGCNGSTTVEEENPPLESMMVSIEKEIEGNVIPTVMVWIDNSTSISEEEKVLLEQKADEIISQNPDAHGPYPFGGGAIGESTGDGWTNLTTPIQASGHNAVVYILTDGWQDAPGTLEGRSFVGPYWGLKVHYVCLERDEHTEELKSSLVNSKEYFQGSTVMIQYLDGTSEDVIIKEFTPQRVTALYEDTDTLYRLSEEAEERITNHQWPWWGWLLLALLVLIPLIILLWWLLRRKTVTEEEETEEGASTGATEPLGQVAGASTGAKEPLGVVPVAGTVEESSEEAEDEDTGIFESSDEDYSCNCCHCHCHSRCRCNAIAIAAMAMVAMVATVAIAIVAMLI